jgi:imidazolonepropionase-like amidohydrolase
MRELLCKEPWLSPREALEMATINGAAAIGQRNSLGCIRAGAQADLIALPLRRSADVYESIVGYDEAVSWMMVDGKITLPV